MLKLRHNVLRLTMLIWVAAIMVPAQATDYINQVGLSHSKVNQQQAQEQAVKALAGLTLPFEENQGQFNPKVAFKAQTLAGPLFITEGGEIVWSLINQQDRTNFVNKSTPGYTVVEHFVNGQPKPIGSIPSQTQVSYFHGNDRSKWRSSASTWSHVNLGQVWPGIEVSLAARGNNAEKLFTVAPGADAAGIVLEVAGGTLKIENKGGLRVEHNGQPLVTFTAPIAWQEIEGKRKPVQVAYRVQEATKNRYSFALGEYDPTRPVIIDPIIQSTYLGGSAEEDMYGFAMYVTADAVYVASDTRSTDFPGTVGGAQISNGGGDGVDFFIVKLSRDLRTIIQSTYLGGNGNDSAKALVVTNDAMYVAGYASSGFPGTAGGIQETTNGGAIVAKLSLDLHTLIQATYLGTNNWISAIATTTDTVYVTGAGGWIQGTGGGAQVTQAGGADSFVAALTLDLRTLVQATYLGGASDDYANALVVTTDGIYIVGGTNSTDFPNVTNAAQSTKNGSTDAFVAKLSLDLGQLLQSTYLGGSDADNALAIAVTTDGVYVSGETSSTNFPGTTGGAQAIPGGNRRNNEQDAFVAKLSLDLHNLAQSTYLGGSAYDRANALAVTADGVYVGGPTTSTDFPHIAGGADRNIADNQWSFVSRLNLDLRSIVQSTYLGAGNYLTISALNLTNDGVYVAGQGGSANMLPNTTGGAQATSGGSWEAFVTKFDLSLAAIASTYVLTISKSGTGNGTITSSLSGINCGSTCSANFAKNINVTLTAVPAIGSTFAGWSGACSGISTSCTVSMTAAQNVTATFNLLSSPICTASWNAQTSTTTNILSSVVWNGTEFLAVGAGGVVVTSPDSMNWTSRTVGTTNTLNSVTWSGTQFVAVSGVLDKSLIYTSADGITWTEHVSTGNPVLHSIVWNGGLNMLIAVGEQGAILTSGADAATWTVAQTGQAYTLNAITSTGNLQVAVGTGSTILTSTDGITWVQRSAGTSGINIRTITWNGNQFLAAGNGSLVFISPDGINWTSKPVSFDFYNIVWNGSRYIAAGATGIATSSNGQNWTVDFSQTTTMRYIAWSGTELVAVGDNGTVLNYCTSGQQDVVTAVSYDSAIPAALPRDTFYVSSPRSTGLDYMVNAKVFATQTGGTIESGGQLSLSLNGTLAAYLFNSQIDLTFHGLNTGDVITAIYSGTDKYRRSTGSITIGDTYALTVATSGTGTGKVTTNQTTSPDILCGAGGTDCSQQYAKSTPAAVVTLITAAASGSSFSNWGGACSGTTTTCSVTMNAAKSVTATFTANSTPTNYTVTPVIGKGGTVTPSTPQTVAANTAKSFTVITKTGYIKSPKGVSGTCPKGNWNGNTWTTGAINANCSVNFDFLCLACIPGQGGWRAVIGH